MQTYRRILLVTFPGLSSRLWVDLLKITCTHSSTAHTTMAMLGLLVKWGTT